jgi:tetratricopeptide (TPR) repeat protein
LEVDLAMGSFARLSMTNRQSMLVRLPPENELMSILLILIAGLVTQAAAFADTVSTDRFDFPGKGDKQQWEKAARIYNEGVDLFHASKTDQAIEKFNQAIATYPYDPNFYNELGLAFDDKGNLAASEAAYRNATALNSRNWKQWGNLGIVLYEQDRFKEAKDAFNQALKLNPPDRDKAAIEENIEIIDEALADKLNPPTLVELQKRIEHDPKEIRAYVWLSQAKILANQPKDAITTALKGLESDPKNSDLKINLAHGYLLNGEFEKAKTVYLENQDRRNAVLKDFKEMRQHGITSPDMDKIEAILTNNTSTTTAPSP